MMKAADTLYSGKWQAFSNMSLPRNTAANGIPGLSDNVQSQIWNKAKAFPPVSIAIDKSTDVNDVAQLAMFIQDADQNINATEEFVELVSMKQLQKRTYSTV